MKKLERQEMKYLKGGGNEGGGFGCPTIPSMPISCVCIGDDTGYCEAVVNSSNQCRCHNADNTVCYTNGMSSGCSLS